jgi:ligand-binding SRPBCC domain-containing protein
MKVYTFEETQIIPAGLDACWEFFSSPHNLPKITPPSMGFQITSTVEEKSYAGQIITYRVKPLLGIPVTWVTEITQCREREYFIDEQRSGPYRFWHHSHFFRAVPGGTEMRDVVRYALPFGFIGRAGMFIVKRKIREIFDFRKEAISRFFPGS